MNEVFVTRDGEKKLGTIIYQYRAFEGDMRYIFNSDNREYRCVKIDGQYVEYVA